MDKLPIIILGVVFVTVLIGLAYAAYRHEARAEARDRYENGDLGHISSLLRPVEHEGAVADWSPAADVTPGGDPLKRELSELDLADAPLFEEIAAAHPVRLDWAPPGFTQEWSTLGTVLAEMGETQPLPRIEVAA